MTEARRLTLDLPGGRMAGLAFGDPARLVDVVFLHATGFNASTYRQSLAVAAQTLHIVALDQRGHGLTELPAEPQTLESWTPFADDLIAAIEAMEPAASVVLSGHSMGGAVAIHAAAALGGRVKALALFDPVVMPVRHPTKWVDSPLVAGARRRRPTFASKEAALQAYQGRGAFKTWPVQAVADYVEDGFRPDGDGVVLTCAPEWEAAIFSVSTIRDPQSSLERVQAPVRVLKADHGATCHIDRARYIDPYPQRSLETVAGSSHFLPMERPELVAQTLKEACR